MSRATDVVRLRLRSQYLADSAIKLPEDLVSRLGAVQAQEYGPARWGIGQRLQSGTDADVERAIDDGRIVRTHILRPTWHFVARGDLRWLLALSAPRVHQANGHMYRVTGLDSRALARGANAICRALEGHRHLTRQELAAELKKARLPHVGQGLAYVVMHAELEGLICSGSRRVKQSTYALVDERVPAALARGTDEALALLTQRYFATRGPATVRDFSWWSGLTLKQVREGIAICGDQLRSGEIDGRVHYWVPGARDARAHNGPRVHLLPIYDEFLIAYKDRQWTAGPPPVRAGADGLIDRHPHQFVIDGRVVGGWRRTVGTKAIQIDVVPHRALTRPEQQALEAEAERLGRFMRLEARLTVD